MATGDRPPKAASEPDKTLVREYAANGEPEIAAGTMVGEYRIEEQLGEGAFGSVYRATHPIIGKTAAIKVLRQELSSNAEVVSRFIDEARAVNQIRHKHIIDIFAFGTLPDGRNYYVMELLDGITLEKHVAALGRLDLVDALAILRPLSRALHAAHTRGIAHRDLKPDNVLLWRNDEGELSPKLLDFGIAKLFGDGAATSRTAPGVPMGTPAYMSPEQVEGKPTDHRGDIYAFGVLVFELLTGALPFHGKTALDVMIKHTAVAAPPMSARCADLAPELDAPVLHMMAKDPADRPQSVLAALDALTEAAERAGLVPIGKFSRLDTQGGHRSTPAEKSPTLVERAQSDAAPGARSRHLLFGMITAAACVGIIVLAVRLSRPEPHAAPAASETPSSNEPAPAASASAVSADAASDPTVSPASSASAKIASSAAEPSTVKLLIEASPPDAQVLLGKKTLGHAGEEIALARGSRPIRIVVARRGFAPKVMDVVPDHDIKEKVTLTPAKKDYTFD